MTRQQVAKRLGKSVATVRRIEGVLLHPARDARGIHRFADEEVEDLARKIESGAVTVWQELRRDSVDTAHDASPVEFGSCDRCASSVGLEQELQALRDDFDEMRRRDRLGLESERIELDRERAMFTAERHEFEVQVVQFMATVDRLAR
ncbi:MAG TPA: hypothetical protein VIK01_16195 [Polyangiaceae bacterium]